MIESFWSTMQRELLDQSSWETPEQLGSGDLRVDRGLVNPRRQHTSLGMLSPIGYEHHWRTQHALHAAADGAE